MGLSIAGSAPEAGVAAVVDAVAVAAAGGLAAAVAAVVAGTPVALTVSAAPAAACTESGGALEGGCTGIEVVQVLAVALVPFPAKLAGCRRAGWTCTRSCSAAAGVESDGLGEPDWS